MAKFGWGDLVGKIANWFPSKEENLRNTVAKLRKERDELLSKPETVATYSRLVVVLDKLRQAEEALANRA